MGGKVKKRNFLKINNFTQMNLSLSEALPGVLGNRGNRAFILGEQRPNFEGNKGQIFEGNKDNIGEQGT